MKYWKNDNCLCDALVALTVKSALNIGLTGKVFYNTFIINVVQIMKCLKFLIIRTVVIN